jgi:hypothetical protein
MRKTSPVCMFDRWRRPSGLTASPGIARDTDNPTTLLQNNSALVCFTESARLPLSEA